MKPVRKILTVFQIFLVFIFIISYASYTSASTAATSDLFFSEYIEGSSNNKALEIYNGTGGAIDLAAGNYDVQMFFNGSSSAGLTIALTGTVADGDVFVLAHSSAVTAILDEADQTDGSGWFNGDDAVVLRKNGTVIDAIGQVGVDPGSEWGSGNQSTQNNTLRRMSSICQGDTNETDAFDPSTEWDGYAEDTFNGLGVHTANCGVVVPPIIINEVDADQDSTDSAEFVELYDGGTGSPSLNDLVLVLYNGNGDVSYNAFDLDGYSTDGNGYFVLCGDNVNVANCDLDVSPDTNLIQNGADAVALYTGDATDFPNGTAVTTTDLLDAIVYDTNDDDDAGLLMLLNPGQPQVNEDGNGNKDGHSNQRDPNGSGGARNTDTYNQCSPTPGEENYCTVGPEFGVCGDPATFIHAIQGAGSSSPEEGNLHVVEGVVMGDFQDSSIELGGFFLQEEDADADGDPLTSEGIFVYAPGFGVDVNEGDLVRLKGEVDEYYGLTELKSISDHEMCDGEFSATAAIVTLPVSSLDYWERHEGMLVKIQQTLYATENYNQGRYGEVELSINSRLSNPTNVVEPGTAANDMQDLNDRSRIQMDDGSRVQNPTPLPPYLGLDNTLRAGDTFPWLLGVLGYHYGAYEIHPTVPATFTRVNNRPPVPDNPNGALMVASFNVLNYFTTIDTGSPICGPSGDQDCRGADSAEEFTRQRDKIIDAIAEMDADIVGLIEIENNATTAIQDLVDGLNNVMGSGTYDFIDTGTIGTDAIKVALIYKPGSVSPVGSYAILDSSVDPTFNDAKNRPVLAQTFADNEGEIFTVAVNHLKSKGSSCESIGDPDTGDGQGNCNLTRTSAATALANLLKTYPTGIYDLDFLILGDLNAYAKEDPVDAIKDAGYTDLVDSYGGDNKYSYVYKGQAGYLDHALSNFSLTLQVAGAMVWHINADEPSALNYNDYNQPGLYSADRYRSSDHDPVVVFLELEDLPRIYLPLVGKQ